MEEGEGHGGVEQVLYQLSAGGQVLHSLATEHCIRHIRSGEIPGAELYLRSAAMAAFCPIMQYHSEFHWHRKPSRKLRTLLPSRPLIQGRRPPWYHGR